MSEILLHNGRMVDPFEIEKYSFTAHDFIHPLSLLNRYTGHTKGPISVAEHTVKLGRSRQVVERKLQRAATIHDFGEPLTNDIPHPFKAQMPEFVAFETRVQKHIFNVFDEPWDNMLALDEFDRRICADEMAQGFDPPYKYPREPLGITVDFWTWDVAKVHLIQLCKDVGLI